MKILHLVFVYAILIMTMASTAMATNVNPTTSTNPHATTIPWFKKLNIKPMRMGKFFHYVTGWDEQ